MADTIIEYFGRGGGHRCGYCKSESSSISHGMWLHSVLPLHYQMLIDRGWRRCGKYCYKPIMSETCCPQYTIRCDVTNFERQKSHIKVIKKVNRFLNYGKKPGDEQSRGSGIDNGEGDAGRISNIPQNQSKQVKSIKPGSGADPNKPKCVKAKLLRKQKRMEKNAEKPESSKSQCKSTSPPTKSIEDFLGEIIENPAHRLEVRLVQSSPRSAEFDETFAESFDLFKRYQRSIHKDPDSQLTEHRYTRFLVTSSLLSESQSRDRPGLGSFHQQYILDGRIIAVGVLDILPHCTSSVYLYYDPDYDFLSLGTYTAIREAIFTKQLTKVIPTMKFYYMGYYIHSCPKMRYKGNFGPSYLACPETFKWCPYDQCAKKLDKNKYSRLSSLQEEDTDGKGDFKNTLILNRRRAIPYSKYHQRTLSEDMEEVKEYTRLVGSTAASQMLLYRK